MILHDEIGNPLIINQITDKLPTNYTWCLDLKAQDYKLIPIKVLEECTCNTVTLKINDRYIDIPNYWYVLVCDPDTTQVDTVQASVLSNNTFYALVYGSNASIPEYLQIQVVDWNTAGVHVYPTHSRGMMLCLDIGNDKWISCSFSDTYTRFLKNKTAGDLIGY